MLLNSTMLSLFGLATIVAAAPAANSPLIDDAQLQVAGMFRYWQAHLPIADNDSVLEGHLVDESLYVITDGGSLFALHADFGLIRWAEKLTEPDFCVYRPSHIRTADGAGPVVIPTTTRVFIYDRFSGDLLQSFTPRFAAGSPAVGYDDKLFIGSADGRFYSLGLNHPRAREPVKRWEVLANGPVTAAPVLYDQNSLLFASQGGTVYSCRAEDRTLHWRFDTGEPILGDPVVDESGVYVAGTDRSLYKLDLGTGTVIWRFRMSRPLVEGPVVTTHTVYQYCAGHGLSALDADTGREKWRNADGRAFAAHTQSGDFIFTFDRRLQLVSHDTGEVRHTIHVPEAVGTVVNTRDDAVYVLGREGRVLCTRLDNVPYLRRQQVIAARARLKKPPRGEAEALRLRREKTGEKVDPLANDPLRSRRDVRP